MSVYRIWVAPKDGCKSDWFRDKSGDIAETNSKYIADHIAFQMTDTKHRAFVVPLRHIKWRILNEAPDSGSVT